MKLLNSVDELVYMREEPHEIASDVTQLAEAVSQHVGVWLGQRCATSEREWLQMVAKLYVEFVYRYLWAEQYPRSITLFRTPKKHHSTFANLLAKELQEPEMAAIVEIQMKHLQLYFKYLKGVHKATFDALLGGRMKKPVELRGLN